MIAQSGSLESQLSEIKSKYQEVKLKKVSNFFKFYYSVVKFRWTYNDCIFFML